MRGAAGLEWEGIREPSARGRRLNHPQPANPLGPFWPRGRNVFRPLQASGPVSDSFHERLQDEIPDWVDEGIVEPDQAQRILERYEDERRVEATSTSDRTTALLYGTAAVLLGAAAIAFVEVGLGVTQDGAWLLGLGLAIGAAGGVLHRVAPDRDLLVDTLLAASMAPLATSTWTVTDPQAPLLYAVPAIGVPAFLLVWRRRQPFVPPLAVIGFSVSAGAISFELLREAGISEGTSAAIWMVLQVILVSGLVLVDRWLEDEDATAPVALSVLALAGSLIAFLVESVELQDGQTIELVLGGLMTLVLVAGIPLQHRGLILGASIALGIDAIVFAFDVGGVFFGSALLLSLAIALIVQAETIKRWVEQAA